MIGLDTKISQLNRVGQATGSKLKKLGIEIAADLIFYYPFRYEDFSQVTPIAELKPGMTTTVVGRLELIANRRSARQRKFLTEAVVSDDSGSVKVIWFNQPWIVKNLKAGEAVSLSGKVAGDLFNIYFNSPEYEKVGGGTIHTGRIVPIYPSTAGLTQKQLRFLISQAIKLAEQVADYLPPAISRGQSLAPLSQALKQIHFPQTLADIAAARARLAFDELFLIQLWSKQLRRQLDQLAAYQIKFFEAETKELVAGLPFKLTDDQRLAAWEIINDMAGKRPMNRLVEGDVGSGKTIVAAIAAYNVALNRRQTAFLTPTEILASQHFQTIQALLGPAIKIGLLTRSRRLIGDREVSKKEFLQYCHDGEIDLVIGTHALIQQAVSFRDLALVVVDEQHRFGVAQREALKQKGAPLPHFLSLTATPIPRSLALTVYGDLDLSIIRQLPAGRQPVITKVVSPEKRLAAYEFIAGQIKTGRQVFVVCPLIDPSDKLGARSVSEEFKKLNEQVFPETPVGLLHGKLKPAEKERAMADFLAGRTKILVATAVVEVGVDIKNAAVIMIEGAERFGLAQLHQFRGRVGRDRHQSYCFLFSDSGDEKTLARLKTLVECHDGFTLAQKDLAYRGAGEIYGREQSGRYDLKIATLDDLVLAKKAAVAAEKFITAYDLQDYPLLQAKLQQLNLSAHLE